MKVHHIELRPTRTKKGIQWAWHAIARNGRKLGWTGEKHTRREHCVEAMHAVTDCFNRGIVVREFDVRGVRIPSMFDEGGACHTPPQRKPPRRAGANSHFTPGFRAHSERT